MHNIALPSVQSLWIEMCFNNQPIATGTAFVAPTRSGHALVTNRHNVTRLHQETGKTLSGTGGVPNQLTIMHNVKGQLGRWQPKIEQLFSGEEPRWIEHPTMGARADFVALPLSQLDNVELYPHDPGNPGADLFLGPADIVSVIGFPFGLAAGGAFGVWATGFLASEPIVDYGELPIQLIDCRSRQGQSGSPVIAYRSGGVLPMSDGGSTVFAGPVSRFIGIYSGRINSESDLGIVWKANAIHELLQTI